jgi:RNA polymerase sigma-70 factor (ECF subfamily)
MLSTSPSLLQRVRRLEPAAWERLCALYGPVVYGWCRRAGLQDSDALDGVQEVFRLVFQHLGQFQEGRGGGRFRGWLWAITTNQLRLHHRQAQRRPTVGDRDPAEFPANLDDPPSCEDAPEGEAVRQAVIRRALDLVRHDFTEQTWLIFVRTTLQEQSCQDVAAELGLSANAVRQARFRVLRRLRQELDGLI